MGARAWIIGAAAITAMAGAGAAGADPQPKRVDLAALRDQAVVLVDGDGGSYIVIRGGKETRVFYGAGPGKPLHEQVITSRSQNGDAWSIGVWAPRVAETRPGTIERAADGSYQKTCDGKDDHQLTQVTGDKARVVLEKSSILTSALIRRPHVLARDDGGTYYYVDALTRQYGGKGYRVFVGKKGSMKELPLTDVASDTAGDVFATKTGDLRLVTSPTKTATWVRGGKRTELIALDLDVNSPLIFRDLGLYKFLGTICDNI